MMNAGMTTRSGNRSGAVGCNFAMETNKFHVLRPGLLEHEGADLVGGAVQRHLARNLVRSIRHDGFAVDVVPYRRHDEISDEQ